MNPAGDRGSKKAGTVRLASWTEGVHYSTHPIEPVNPAGDRGSKKAETVRLASWTEGVHHSTHSIEPVNLAGDRGSKKAGTVRLASWTEGVHHRSQASYCKEDELDVKPPSWTHHNACPIDPAGERRDKAVSQEMKKPPSCTEARMSSFKPGSQINPASGEVLKSSKLQEKTGWTQKVLERTK